MNIKQEIQLAASNRGIMGIMALTEHCKLSYERTRRVWEGHPGVKFADVELVLTSLGAVLECKQRAKGGAKS
jgi:hypothetical protein